MLAPYDDGGGLGMDLMSAAELRETVRRAFDGAFGGEILAACEQHGLIGLALYDSGSRNFYNTRHPIEAPSDLHGLKLRVPQSDIFIESVEALGASPTPLAYNAVFSSLSTHLIDGAENNWPSYFTSRHFEIAPYWSESEHSYAPDVLLMSKRVADALPPLIARYAYTDEFSTPVLRAAHGDASGVRGAAMLWDQA